MMGFVHAVVGLPVRVEKYDVVSVVVNPRSEIHLA